MPSFRSILYRATLPFIGLPLVGLMIASPLLAQEQTRRPDLQLELGAAWQERNKVQIPNTAAADRFQLDTIAGNGPWTSGRVTVNWPLRGRHGLRLVLAPLAYEEESLLTEDIRFAGGEFDSSAPVQAEYKFNSWRFGYHYQFYAANNWQLRIGATAKIRDARIELSQGAVNAEDDDVGFVPLLHLSGDYQFNPRWSFHFDFDGLAGGPGRAFDLGLRLAWAVNDNWRLGVGYRGLEGGVDNDDVYNFAWFNSALVTAEYRF